MKKIINLLLYAGLDKETNEKYKDYVLKQDVKNLTYYLLLAGVLYLILGGVSVISSGFAHKNTIVYFSTAVSFLIILVFQRLTIKLRGSASRVNRLYIYLFMIVLYFESIILTATHKDLPAVTYIGILLVLPLLFAQYPLPMCLFQSCFVAVFCIFVSYYKYPEIAAVDVWNSITFLLVSIIVIVLVVPMRVNQIIRSEIIRELSETDMLTRLKNRNSFESFCAGITHINKNMGCIFADVNGLHELNNRYGHEAGDSMLKAVASTMMKSFGSENTYRIGGDEFVAMVFEFDHDQVEEYTLEVKKELSDMGYHVSMGFAGYEGCDEGIEELIKRAESKMYEDKRTYYSTKGTDRRFR